MNAAKMPQLRSQLPERSRRKKNRARRTRVAECRLYAADRSRMPSECRQMPQPAWRRLYRLGPTAPTADRPEKITLERKITDSKSKPEIFKNSRFCADATRPYPPPRSFQPFSPGYTLSFPRLIPTYRPGPQAIDPQATGPHTHRSNRHDTHSHHRCHTHPL